MVKRVSALFTILIIFKMSQKKVKIIALLPLVRFGFPHSDGQELSVEAKQADEMIEAGYAVKYNPKLEKAEKAVEEAEAGLNSAKIAFDALPADAAADVKETAQKVVTDAEKDLADAEAALAEFEN